MLQKIGYCNTYAADGNPPVRGSYCMHEKIGLKAEVVTVDAAFLVTDTLCYYCADVEFNFKRTNFTSHFLSFCSL